MIWVPALLSFHRDDINKAADLLRGGGLVAFPTETVYGLGGDAPNDRAVAASTSPTRGKRAELAVVGELGTRRGAASSAGQVGVARLGAYPDRSARYDRVAAAVGIFGERS
jgi:hypothetical protein